MMNFSLDSYKIFGSYSKIYILIKNKLQFTYMYCNSKIECFIIKKIATLTLLL